MEFHGVPLREGVLDDDHLARFLAKITVTADGHWIWTGGRDGHGYGMFSREGRGRGAHRVAYDVFVGDLDPDLTIDHGCYDKRCVTPSCLEQVTREENSRRGWHRSQWWRDAMQPGVERRRARAAEVAEMQRAAEVRDAGLDAEAKARLMRCPMAWGEPCPAQEAGTTISVERYLRGDGKRPRCPRCDLQVLTNREHCERCEAHILWTPRAADRPQPKLSPRRRRPRP